MDCQKVKDSLVNFFNNSIKIESDSKECRIVVPIYGRDNDLLELSVRKSSLSDRGKYYITDDAETISSLYLYGIEVEKEGKPKSILESIEKSLNVEIVDGEIRAYANDDDLGLTISKIISSILGVQYIQYLTRPKTIIAFKQKVKVFLDEKAPDYEYNAKVKGLTGEKSRFDFGFPQHDIYIDTLYGATDYYAFEQTLKTCMKSVEITRVKPELKVVAVFDDVDEESKDWWTSRSIHYMENYLYKHIPWSKKEKILEIIQ